MGVVTCLPFKHDTRDSDGIKKNKEKRRKVSLRGDSVRREMERMFNRKETSLLYLYEVLMIYK